MGKYKNIYPCFVPPGNRIRHSEPMKDFVGKAFRRGAKQPFPENHEYEARKHSRDEPNDSVDGPDLFIFDQILRANRQN